MDGSNARVSSSEEIEIVHPGSMEEAVQALSADDPGVRPIAGGTALMLLATTGFLRPHRLVSLRRVPGLRGTSVKDGELRIGAMTSLRELELSEVVRRAIPVVVETLGSLANIRIRNVATVGGHLVHADPHMDLPPVLLVLDATVRAQGHRGSREIRVEDLITGYYATSLTPDEVITELIVPLPDPTSKGTYLKFTALSSDDWPTLGVAAMTRTDNGKLAEVRIAIGGVGDRPLRLRSAEELLRGQPPTDDLVGRAAASAASEIRPSSDNNGSAAFKRELTRVQVSRALEKVLAS